MFVRKYNISVYCDFFTTHVEHVHKLTISVEALIRKNFVTLDGFVTKYHVTSP